MATKRVPKARISVSTPELAIIFRGESVSGHPGARGGPKSPENRTEIFNILGEKIRDDVRDFFGPPRAPWWPETDSPLKMIATSGDET